MSSGGGDGAQPFVAGAQASGRSLQKELERVARVSDMLCTAHADLRNRYGRRALWLDLAVLLPSAWLVALAFVEPSLNKALTPGGLEPQIWTGMLAVTVFALSIVQLRVDWKGRTDAHARAFEGFAEVKRDAGFVLASAEVVTEEVCRPIFARYGSASSTPVPEPEFLLQKRRHLLKIAVSRHLDVNPAASPALTKVRFWMRDNFRPARHSAPQR